MKIERSFFFAAAMVGCVLLLPVISFVLISLWPQRVLASWLLFSLLVLVILVRLAILVIKAATVAKVRLSEEALRPGRLYAHERLVEGEGRYHGEWTTQEQLAVRDEPYVQHPFVYPPHRQAPNSYKTNNISYSGLKPLNIDSYDWEEEK
jgi:hypothetical protein